MPLYDPRWIIYHDYGKTPEDEPGVFNPYHALVFPSGNVRYRNASAPLGPFSQKAPHAAYMNNKSLGLAYAGSEGEIPTPAGMRGLQNTYEQMQRDVGPLPGMGHGEAYEAWKAGQPGIDQPSIAGRDLAEASGWRGHIADLSQVPDSGKLPDLSLLDLKGDYQSAPPVPAGEPGSVTPTPTPTAPMGAPKMPLEDADTSNGGYQQPGFLQGLPYNPLFMMGLSILGTKPGGDWGPHAAQAAAMIGKSQIAQADFQREEQQRAQTRSAWAKVFPNGQPNFDHPLLKDVSPQLATAAQMAGPEVGLPALQKFALTGDDRALKAAHSAYYNAAAKLAEAKGGASTMNAESRRLKIMGDITDRWANTMPTQEEWDRENQPGGLINAAFGVKIPYDQAKPTLIQAQQQFQSQFEPTPEEKLMGITRENKIQMRREQMINEGYGAEGKNLINKGVRLTPSGDFVARRGANTQSERQGATLAQTGLQNLEAGWNELKKETGVLGTAQQFFGDTDAAHFPYNPGKLMPSGIGTSGQAYRKIKAAILDLNFALSGKSVSNKEREAFLDLYMPKWHDSKKTQEQKIGMVRNYFNNVMEMRNQGATDAELKAVHDAAIKDGEALSPPKTRGGKYEGMTDDEIKRLLHE